MLGVVQSNLKMVNFFIQHLWMFHDFVVVWPGSCTLVRFSIPNMSREGGQTHETCCPQQWCDMFRPHVAIVWPELANAAPTMLGYVMLKCFDRLPPGRGIKSCVEIVAGWKKDYDYNNIKKNASWGPSKTRCRVCIIYLLNELRYSLCILRKFSLFNDCIDL